MKRLTTTMGFRFHFRCLVGLSVSLMLLAQATSALTRTIERQKRQLPAGRDAQAEISPSNRLVDTAVSSSAVAIASSSVGDVNRRPTNQLDSVRGDFDLNHQKRRPEAPQQQPAPPSVQVPPIQQQQQQPKRRPAADRRRPIRPSNQQDDYDEPIRHTQDHDADCQDDDDYEYHSGVWPQMFDHPMRNFRSMMNNVFDQMPNFGRYGGANFAPGGSFKSSASATSYSSNDGDDGFSSSVVTNNGRTRGIISETRNGRTKTKRIGDDNDANYARQSSAANYEDDDD